VAYPAPAPVYSAPAPHEFFGTLLGAISGGVIGAQIGSGSGRAAAIAGGILLGSLVGNTIGRGLDDYDRRLAYQSTQYALESMRSGTEVEWRGGRSGAHGTVIPRPAFQNQLGQYCREFQETVVIGGQPQSAYGTACRQDDGQWRILQ
jgi:surface antigen